MSILSKLPLLGASRLLALNRSDEIVVEGLRLVLLCFLLLVVALFGSPAETLVISAGALPLSLSWLKKAPTASSPVA